MNFSEKFRQFVRTMDAPKVARTSVEEKPAPRVPRFNLISIFEGRWKIIGFNLTRPEAELLEIVARKKIRRLPESDAGGSPLFELTELVAERV